MEINRHDARVRITQAISPWAGWAFIALFAWLSIHDLAGKITVADISVLARTVFGDKDTGACPAWYVVGASSVLGIFAIMLARRERKLRKNTTERLHQYQDMWERSQDTSRTSSRLTPRGDTRPEDR